MGFHFLYGNHLNPFLQKNERKSYYFDWKITVFKNHSKISFHLKFPEKNIREKNEIGRKSRKNQEKIQKKNSIKTGKNSEKRLLKNSKKYKKDRKKENIGKI